MGYIAILATACFVSKMVIAANQAIILKSMDRVMMKMLDHRLNKKDGPTVPGLVITSLVFIVDLVIA